LQIFISKTIKLVSQLGKLLQRKTVEKKNIEFHSILTSDKAS